MSLEKCIRKAIRKYYPAQEEGVRDSLDAYCGPERDRVRLDILKLAAGDAGRIPALVLKARQDHADIIAWAEHPVSAKAKLNAYTRTTAARMDREQYEHWLRSLDDDTRPAPAAGERAR